MCGTSSTALGFVSVFSLFAGTACAQPVAALRLNEIQIVGSHNSYHSGLAPGEMTILRQSNPKAADSLDYRHPALQTQLDAGVRQLEIDVFGDSKGGLFAHPAALARVAKAGLPPDPPYDPQGLMKNPGFKVLHVQDVDFRTNCEPLIACLEIVRDWSRAHPRHLPILVLIENKDGNPRPGYMTDPEKVTPETFDALDTEIRSVFQPADLLTPDDVRGSHKTLEEVILTSGWPTLEQARGKVLFLLDQSRFTPLYTKGHPALEGRVAFTNSLPGTPDAAFIEVNDSTKDPDRIPSLVRKGYLVRTMTDPGHAGVLAGQTQRRDAALASGAQLLSTDYPYDERSVVSGYSVRFEPVPSNRNARCNPVLKPAACDTNALNEAK